MGGHPLRQAKRPIGAAVAHRRDLAARVAVRAQGERIERRGHAARADGATVPGGDGMHRMGRAAMLAPIAQDKGGQLHAAARLGQRPRRQGLITADLIAQHQAGRGGSCL